MNTWLRRLRYGLTRQRHSDDLREELASHQALKEAELRSRGVPDAELRARARRALGSAALAQDRAYDVWIWPWLQDASRDLQLAVRLMATHKSFTAAIVTVLGLGIGIAGLQLTLIDAICLRGLPIDRADRVLFVSARDGSRRDIGLTHEEFEHLRAADVGLEALTAFASVPGVVGDDRQAPDRAIITYVSAPVFDVLRERPQLGRGFQRMDDQPGAPPVAVLTASYWASRYNSDASIIGQQVRVNGTPTTIIGVMSPPLRFPAVTDVWLPMSSLTGASATPAPARRLNVIGRLRDDGSVPAVQTALASTSADLERRDVNRARDLTLTAIPINERYNGRLTDPVWLAFGGIAIVVLLSACANAANLLLMRGAQRGHEIGVRASIGASRWRLVRQLLIESAALALVSGLVGVLLAALALRVTNRIIPPDTLAYWMRFTLDGRALLLVLGISLSSVLLFGLIPAAHLARADVHALLRSGGLAAFGGRRGRWTTTMFLTTQCAFTMVVLAALALGVRSTREISRQFLAIDPTGVLTTWVTPPADRYSAVESRRAFLADLERRVAALPGVSAVATATTLPLGGATARHLVLDSARPIDGASPTTVWAVGVSRDYFDVLGVPLVKGRRFDDRSGRDEASVIVNQRFVEMFLSGRDPLGEHMRLGDPSAPASAGPRVEIIGVVPTVRQRPQSADADPLVYVPLSAGPPSSAVLLIRTATRPEALIAPLRSLVQTIDPELPLYRTLSLSEALDGASWNGRVSAALLNGIAVAGVALGGMGLYAVLAHATLSRRRELAIRMAVGARPTQLMGLVAKDASRYLAFGLTAGVGCVYAFASVTGTRADPISMFDPTVLVAAGGLLTLVTILAGLGPAVRSMRVDPVRALRDV